MTHTTNVASAEREFAEDLKCLSAGELRKKYRGEASCHANMKRRAKQGLCEVDPAWDQFRGFLADMGPRLIPNGSIERIDNSNRRYGPALCRWATKAEQTRNRANTRWANYNGERVTVGELAERLGTPYSTLHSALERGQTAEEVARRLASKNAGSGLYTPPWADTTERQMAVQREYALWLKTVKRPDRRKLVSREVFSIIVAAKMFVSARRRLEQMGIHEIVPDEENDFNARAAKELRIVREALSWAQDAGRALAAADLRLAARLYPFNEADLVRRAEFYEWFTAPIDI
ncbi:hypothetical protein [Sphingomonas dokdonensis]|uniref:Uncharacterized protein n=1 Tax=Sphingomonas dokdonensis TaxID=344880 RepID=A0A245ZV93_9SPHN|nr:hypothetical protein [Sphingomonas dokdonensis]OWK33648.1 hypothetical protein SPDO_05290 [Sphingomonas dokdonensis]